MSEKFFTKTLIIGLGLIGGSFAKSLRQNKISDKIYACDLDPESLEKAMKSEVIDDFVELEDELSSFDFIVLATPLTSYKKIFATLNNRISANAIVIDLGSLKNFDGKILPKNLEKNFVPCHPIAGSEKVGFENSSSELFVGKKFIICPEKSDKNSVKKVEDILKKIGATVDFIEAKKHDEIYALVSHLPQFLSFLTKEFSPKKIEDEFFKNAFRLDNSDAEIWGDIFKLNDENLERFYLEFFDVLEKNIEEFCDNRSPSKARSASSRGHEFGFPPLDDGLRPLLGDLQINQKFFEENFAAIFFRAIIVTSYLQIPEIKTFQNYAGSGFRDFTSIVEILNYDAENLAKLIQKNHSQILKLFNSLS